MALKLQGNLDGLGKNPEVAIKAMTHYLAEINDGWQPDVRRYVHTEEAFHVDDQLTIDSLIYPVRQFGTIMLVGYVPRVRCINIEGRLTVGMPFFDAIVIGPRREIEPELAELDMELENADCTLPLDKKLMRPLFVPIDQMDFSMIVA